VKSGGSSSLNRKLLTNSKYYVFIPNRSQEPLSSYQEFFEERHSGLGRENWSSTSELHSVSFWKWFYQCVGQLTKNVPYSGDTVSFSEQLYGELIEKGMFRFLRSLQPEQRVLLYINK
jgi:hypothetical protein